MPSEAVIKAAIHYSQHETPWDDATELKCANGQHMATNDLCNLGLIVECKSRPEWSTATPVYYTATPGLKMYVDALKKVPMPTQEWTIQRPPAMRG